MKLAWQFPINTKLQKQNGYRQYDSDDRPNVRNEVKEKRKARKHKG